MKRGVYRHNSHSKKWTRIIADEDFRFPPDTKTEVLRQKWRRMRKDDPKLSILLSGPSRLADEMLGLGGTPGGVPLAALEGVSLVAPDGCFIAAPDGVTPPPNGLPLVAPVRVPPPPTTFASSPEDSPLTASDGVPPPPPPNDLPLVASDDLHLRIIADEDFRFPPDTRTKVLRQKWRRMRKDDPKLSILLSGPSRLADEMLGLGGTPGGVPLAALEGVSLVAPDGVPLAALEGVTLVAPDGVPLAAPVSVSIAAPDGVTPPPNGLPLVAPVRVPPPPDDISSSSRRHHRKKWTRIIADEDFRFPPDTKTEVLRQKWRRMRKDDPKLSILLSGPSRLADQMLGLGGTPALSKVFLLLLPTVFLLRLSKVFSCGSRRVPLAALEGVSLVAPDGVPLAAPVSVSLAAPDGVTPPPNGFPLVAPVGVPPPPDDIRPPPPDDSPLTVPTGHSKKWTRIIADEDFRFPPDTKTEVLRQKWRRMRKDDPKLSILLSGPSRLADEMLGLGGTPGGVPLAALEGVSLVAPDGVPLAALEGVSLVAPDGVPLAAPVSVFLRLPTALLLLPTAFLLWLPPLTAPDGVPPPPPPNDLPLVASDDLHLSHRKKWTRIIADEDFRFPPDTKTEVLRQKWRRMRKDDPKLSILLSGPSRLADEMLGLGGTPGGVPLAALEGVSLVAPDGVPLAALEGVTLVAPDGVPLAAPVSVSIAAPDGVTPPPNGLPLVAPVRVPPPPDDIRLLLPTTVLLRLPTGHSKKWTRIIADEDFRFPPDTKTEVLRQKWRRMRKDDPKLSILLSGPSRLADEMLGLGGTPGGVPLAALEGVSLVAPDGVPLAALEGVSLVAPDGVPLAAPVSVSIAAPDGVTPPPNGFPLVAPVRVPPPPDDIRLLLPKTKLLRLPTGHSKKWTRIIADEDFRFPPDTKTEVLRQKWRRMRKDDPKLSILLSGPSRLADQMLGLGGTPGGSRRCFSCCSRRRSSCGSRRCFSCGSRRRSLAAPVSVSLAAPDGVTPPPNGFPLVAPVGVPPPPDDIRPPPPDDSPLTASDGVPPPPPPNDLPLVASDDLHLSHSKKWTRIIADEDFRFPPDTKTEVLRQKWRRMRKDDPKLSILLSGPSRLADEMLGLGGTPGGVPLAALEGVSLVAPDGVPLAALEGVTLVAPDGVPLAAPVSVSIAAPDGVTPPPNGLPLVAPVRVPPPPDDIRLLLPKTVLLRLPTGHRKKWTRIIADEDFRFPPDTKTEVLRQKWRRMRKDDPKLSILLSGPSRLADQMLGLGGTPGGSRRCFSCCSRRRSSCGSRRCFSCGSRRRSLAAPVSVSLAAPDGVTPPPNGFPLVAPVGVPPPPDDIRLLLPTTVLLRLPTGHSKKWTRIIADEDFRFPPDTKTEVLRQKWRRMRKDDPKLSILLSGPSRLADEMLGLGGTPGGVPLAALEGVSLVAPDGVPLAALEGVTLVAPDGVPLAAPVSVSIAAPDGVTPPPNGLPLVAPVRVPPPPDDIRLLLPKTVLLRLPTGHRKKWTRIIADEDFRFPPDTKTEVLRQKWRRMRKDDPKLSILLSGPSRLADQMLGLGGTPGGSRRCFSCCSRRRSSCGSRRCFSCGSRRLCSCCSCQCFSYGSRRCYSSSQRLSSCGSRRVPPPPDDIRPPPPDDSPLTASDGVPPPPPPNDLPLVASDDLHLSHSKKWTRIIADEDFRFPPDTKTEVLRQKWRRMRKDDPKLSILLSGPSRLADEMLGLGGTPGGVPLAALEGVSLVAPDGVPLAALEGVTLVAPDGVPLAAPVSVSIAAPDGVTPPPNGLPLVAPVRVPPPPDDIRLLLPKTVLLRLPTGHRKKWTRIIADEDFRFPPDTKTEVLRAWEALPAALEGVSLVAPDGVPLAALEGVSLVAPDGFALAAPVSVSLTAPAGVTPPPNGFPLVAPVVVPPPLDDIRPPPPDDSPLTASDGVPPPPTPNDLPLVASDDLHLSHSKKWTRIIADEDFRFPPDTKTEVLRQKWRRMRKDDPKLSILLSGPSRLADEMLGLGGTPGGVPLAALEGVSLVAPDGVPLAALEGVTLVAPDGVPLAAPVSVSIAAPDGVTPPPNGLPLVAPVRVPPPPDDIRLLLPKTVLLRLPTGHRKKWTRIIADEDFRFPPDTRTKVLRAWEALPAALEGVSLVAPDGVPLAALEGVSLVAPDGFALAAPVSVSLTAPAGVTPPPNGFPLVAPVVVPPPLDDIRPPPPDDSPLTASDGVPPPPTPNDLPLVASDDLHLSHSKKWTRIIADEDFRFPPDTKTEVLRQKWRRMRKDDPKLSILLSGPSRLADEMLGLGGTPGGSRRCFSCGSRRLFLLRLQTVLLLLPTAFLLWLPSCSSSSRRHSPPPPDDSPLTASDGVPPPPPPNDLPLVASDDLHLSHSKKWTRIIADEDFRFPPDTKTEVLRQKWRRMRKDDPKLSILLSGPSRLADQMLGLGGTPGGSRSVSLAAPDGVTPPPNGFPLVAPVGVPPPPDDIRPPPPDDSPLTASDGVPPPPPPNDLPLVASDDLHLSHSKKWTRIIADEDFRFPPDTKTEVLRQKWRRMRKDDPKLSILLSGPSRLADEMLGLGGTPGGVPLAALEGVSLVAPDGVPLAALEGVTLVAPDGVPLAAPVSVSIAAPDGVTPPPNGLPLVAPVRVPPPPDDIRLLLPKTVLLRLPTGHRKKWTRIIADEDFRFPPDTKTEVLRGWEALPAALEGVSLVAPDGVPLAALEGVSLVAPDGVALAAPVSVSLAAPDGVTPPPNGFPLVAPVVVPPPPDDIRPPPPDDSPLTASDGVPPPPPPNDLPLVASDDLHLSHSKKWTRIIADEDFRFPPDTKTEVLRQKWRRMRKDDPKLSILLSGPSRLADEMLGLGGTPGGVPLAALEGVSLVAPDGVPLAALEGVTLVAPDGVPLAAPVSVSIAAPDGVTPPPNGLPLVAPVRVPPPPDDIRLLLPKTVLLRLPTGHRKKWTRIIADEDFRFPPDTKTEVLRGWEALPAALEGVSLVAPDGVPLAALEGVSLVAPDGVLLAAPVSVSLAAPDGVTPPPNGFPLVAPVGVPPPPDDIRSPPPDDSPLTAPDGVPPPPPPNDLPLVASDDLHLSHSKKWTRIIADEDFRFPPDTKTEVLRQKWRRMRKDDPKLSILLSGPSRLADEMLGLGGTPGGVPLAALEGVSLVAPDGVPLAALEGVTLVAPDGVPLAAPVSVSIAAPDGVTPPPNGLPLVAPVRVPPPPDDIRLLLPKTVLLRLPTGFLLLLLLPMIFLLWLPMIFISGMSIPFPFCYFSVNPNGSTLTTRRTILFTPQLELDLKRGVYRHNSHRKKWTRIIADEDFRFPPDTKTEVLRQKWRRMRKDDPKLSILLSGPSRLADEMLGLGGTPGGVPLAALEGVSLVAPDGVPLAALEGVSLVAPDGVPLAAPVSVSIAAPDGVTPPPNGLPLVAPVRVPPPPDDIRLLLPKTVLLRLPTGHRKKWTRIIADEDFRFPPDTKTEVLRGWEALPAALEGVSLVAPDDVPLAALEGVSLVAPDGVLLAAPVSVSLAAPDGVTPPPNGFPLVAPVGVPPPPDDIRSPPPDDSPLTAPDGVPPPPPPNDLPLVASDDLHLSHSKKWTRIIADEDFRFPPDTKTEVLRQKWRRMRKDDPKLSILLSGPSRLADEMLGLGGTPGGVPLAALEGVSLVAPDGVPLAALEGVSLVAPDGVPLAGFPLVAPVGVPPPPDDIRLLLPTTVLLRLPTGTLMAQRQQRAAPFVFTPQLELDLKRGVYRHNSHSKKWTRIIADEDFRFPPDTKTEVLRQKWRRMRKDDPKLSILLSGPSRLADEMLGLGGTPGGVPLAALEGVSLVAPDGVPLAALEGVSLVAPDGVPLAAPVSVSLAAPDGVTPPPNGFPLVAPVVFLLLPTTFVLLLPTTVLLRLRRGSSSSSSQ
ncbi:hypothetical protein KIW84_UN0829 [Lathyrus oleraceus]|nr:hypothetical protein KIW84_UN0829 [Pisum sativum]